MGLVLASGCASTPPPPVEVAPASAPAPPVENGTSVFFNEVMVSVPVEGAHQVYQNLHVGVAANVYARNSASYDASAVAGLLRRLEPRVAAATLQVVDDAGIVVPRKLGALRESIVARIQEVVNQTVGNWEHTAQYQVEVAVVSLYFTDSTVGRSEPARRARN